MKIDMFRIEFTNAFHGLAEYQKAMEAYLPVIQELEQISIEKYRNNNLPNTVPFDSMMEEYDWVYGNFFPRSLRYSFVVLLFLVIEHQLNQLCDEIKKRKNLPIRASEMSGDALKRSKVYLEKVAGISIKNWSDIEDLSKVRNCIVHALGKVELSKDEKHLKQLTKKDVGLSISDKESQEEGFLVVSSDYCESSVIVAQKFFDEIFDAADFGPELSMY
jgi:hypothetical protein